MDLLLVPVPIFNRYAVPEAYLFRYHAFGEIPSENAPAIRFLEALNLGGVDAFTGGKPLFVPLRNEMLLEELDRLCRQPPQKVVFLLEDELPVSGPHLSGIASFRQMGFRFAAAARSDGRESGSLPGMLSFLLLGDEVIGHPDRKAHILYQKRASPELSLIATNIRTESLFDQMVKERVDLLEGTFYYDSIQPIETGITPLKANLIRLLNSVRDENFEFDAIAGIVQRDPALTLTLMRFVNSPHIGVRHKIKTIRHAVTVLGQDEVRKWVMAAVFRSLGAERPNELTRLSLVRAKFAENLAPLFQLENESQSVFLTGLFSLLHVVLQMPMLKVLESISVSDDIWNALVLERGPYNAAMKLILAYERADWGNVARLQSWYSLRIGDIYNAYMNAIVWYNELLFDNVRPLKK